LGRTTECHALPSALLPAKAGLVYQVRPVSLAYQKFRTSAPLYLCSMLIRAIYIQGNQRSNKVYLLRPNTKIYRSTFRVSRETRA